MKEFLLLFAFVGMIFMMSCQSANEASAKEASALLVIPLSSVQDTELKTTKAVLEDSGITVVVGSLENKTVSGMEGGSFTPDVTLSEVSAADYDMIVFIGGVGSMQLFGNQELHTLAREFNSQKKIVAAICAASAIIANAGILDGIEATCYPDKSISDQLVKNGATYINKTVVISGRIITGNGPQASSPFAHALVDAITG